MVASPHAMDAMAAPQSLNRRQQVVGYQTSASSDASSSSSSSAVPLFPTGYTTTYSSSDSAAAPTQSGLPTSVPSQDVTPTTLVPTPTGTNPTASSGASTNSFTSLWSAFSSSTSTATYAATASASAPSASASTYVPAPGQPLLNGPNGALVGLTLAGDSAGQSVYSVPIVFGHQDVQPQSRRRRAEQQPPIPPAAAFRRDRKRSGGGDSDRAPALQLVGRAESTSSSRYQTLNLQVDLGSADVWVAASTCGTSDCTASGVGLYDATRAIDSGSYGNLTFQTGAAAGEIYWDQVQVGVNVSTIETAVNGTGFGGASGFTVSYQAFVAATEVYSEDLSGGSFSGVLGLSPPANSIITSVIPGGTGASPDGATFLDNLFGSGSTAPVGRYFSLSLARWGDSTTSSSLGFGARDTSVCGDPCNPSYSNVVTSASGPLYWRILVDGITVTTSNSPTSSSSGPSNLQTHTMKLPSSSVTSQSWPVAVLDSGGNQILFGDRNLLNAIYGVYNIGPSSDGNYYVPCKQEIAVSFTFGSQVYPLHPLDMSDYTSLDPSHQNCLGSMQYASGLNAGDIILGSSFLKNVYSVYTYPTAGATTRSWQPQVGLISLTNATKASQQFYNVRSLNMPLSSGGASSSGGGNGGNTGSSPGNSAAEAQGHHVISGGIIALAVILGFAGVAAGLFCAWYFWLRRKYGKDGSAPDYQMHVKENGGGGGGDDAAAGARRSKKFRSMQRQKSMIDGYSDFDMDDSYGEIESRTDGSLGTTKSREATIFEDDEGPEPSGHARAGSGHSKASRLSAWESSYPPLGWSPSSVGTPPPTHGGQSRHRDKSPSTSSAQVLLYHSPDVSEGPRSNGDGPYPSLYSPTTRQSTRRGGERTPSERHGTGYFDDVPMRTIRPVPQTRTLGGEDDLLHSSPVRTRRELEDDVGASR